MVIAALGLLGILVCSAPSPGQRVKVEPEQKYLVLEVVKLSTFEAEINEAAKLGFRMVMATTSDDGSRVQALMERAATPPETFTYQLVATFSEKAGDREMNEAGSAGFRLIPHTAMVKKGLTIFNTNSVVLMEKSPASAEHFEYKSSTAVKTSTFHKELRAAVEDGWKVVDMIYGRILLERIKR
jgi:hypothetical protein